MLSDGSYGIIANVREIHYDEAQTTYNFEVADVHTYYVGNGVLVHNMNGQPCGGSKRNNKNQEALIDLAQDNKSGVTYSQAETLVEWGQEYGVSNHGPMIHSNRSGHWSYTVHIKIQKIHIPIIK